MKENKSTIILISLTFIVILTLSLFNIKVSMRQGINYKVRVIKIPLYLKLIDFLSRHYHYNEIVKELLKDCNSSEEKILRLFNWTNQNILKAPENLPIVDDHVWHIIIRGYGTDDQSADVFATLCMYAGFPAKWMKIFPKESTVWLAVTIVKLNEKWLVFDPYRGNYFSNANGKLADMGDIKKDNSIVSKAVSQPLVHGIEYIRYFDNLPNINEEKVLKASKQMLIPRIKYEIRKVFTKS